jgi:hypothetical protein
MTIPKFHNMKKSRFASTILVSLMAVACFTSMASLAKYASSKAYDLSEYGIPVSVVAPEGAEVRTGLVNGEIDGLHIYSADVIKDRFLLMASMWDFEPEESLQEALATQKGIAEENENFVGYLLEEDNGYISKSIADGEADYDFCYILQKGDRHIQFGIAFTITAFTEAEIKTLYLAAKSAH